MVYKLCMLCVSYTFNIYGAISVRITGISLILILSCLLPSSTNVHILFLTEFLRDFTGIFLKEEVLTSLSSFYETFLVNGSFP